MATNYEILSRQLDELETYIENKKVLNPSVSKAPVGWHLSHSLKVFNKIGDSLRTSNPEEYKSTFSFKKMFVFLTGDFPRGRAKSPPSVLPPDIIRKEDLFSQLEEARQMTKEFEFIDPNAYFEHPLFNRLNRKETEKFLAIHTRHHLKIIRDILTVKNK